MTGNSRSHTVQITLAARLGQQASPSSSLMPCWAGPRAHSVRGRRLAVPELVCLGRDAGDLRVGAAHLGQGVKLVSAS